MSTSNAEFLKTAKREEILGLKSAQIEEYDVDSCRQLYLSMIELAVHDYRFLQRMKEQARTSRYDRKKLRQMTEDGDPGDFFNSTWFEEVCDYVGVTPMLIRERLEQEGVDFDIAQVA
jgi:hypothetical protein